MKSGRCRMHGGKSRIRLTLLQPELMTVRLEMAEELRGQTSVYLVAQDPAGHEESAPVKRYYKTILEHELEAWCIDESVWPPNRDLKTFFEWFEVQAESVVWDLEPKKHLNTSGSNGDRHHSCPA